MNCPNDKNEMHQVRINSHFGAPIFLEQCPQCGGIWFDESELFRARQGEAYRIELIDEESLKVDSALENIASVCPKDGTELKRFTDDYFPEGIIVERCPQCSGFWLNRGEFTKYQDARKDLLKQQEVTLKDEKLQRDVEILLQQYREGGGNDTLKKLGSFLSTELDENTLRPLESNERTPEVDNAVNLALNVLASLLSIFTFR